MRTCPRPSRKRSPGVYQLQVVLRGVGPLIWRRRLLLLLVHGDTTIAALHAVLQTAFGWVEQHLHRFEIHGAEYGVSYIGGVGFLDDAHQVQLADLGLRRTERFSYHDDFIDGWWLDLRVEQILRTAPERRKTAAGCGSSSTRPSPTESSPPDCAPPRSSASCARTTSSPRSASIAASSPPCCRCWVWSVSTGAA